MINLQALIPGSKPCIVEANDIEAIYEKEIEVNRNYSDILVLKRYHTDKLIYLKTFGYNDSIEPEVMTKVSFAIQTAKSIKSNKETQ